MADINDGGPAFPYSYEKHAIGEIGSSTPIMDYSSGLTMRDYFAIDALKATANTSWRDLGYKPVDGKSIMENMALCSYQMADAMLKAREVQNG